MTPTALILWLALGLSPADATIVAAAVEPIDHIVACAPPAAPVLPWCSELDAILDLHDELETWEIHWRSHRTRFSKWDKECARAEREYRKAVKEAKRERSARGRQRTGGYAGYTQLHLLQRREERIAREEIERDAFMEADTHLRAEEKRLKAFRRELPRLSASKARRMIEAGEYEPGGPDIEVPTFTPYKRTTSRVVYVPRGTTRVITPRTGGPAGSGRR